MSHTQRGADVQAERQNFLAPPGMPRTRPEGMTLRFHSVLVTAMAVLTPGKFRKRTGGTEGNRLEVPRPETLNREGKKPLFMVFQGHR